MTEPFDVCDRCGKECHGEEHDDMIEERIDGTYEMMCCECHERWYEERGQDE